MSDSQDPAAQPVPTPPPTGGVSNDEKMWRMFCHLSGILLSVLGPVLVWQIKKNELPGVEPHGKEALNFQITVLIAMVAGFVLTAVSLGFLGCIVVPLLMLVGLANVVLSIIAGIKANNGEFYTYPCTLRLVK